MNLFIATIISFFIFLIGSLPFWLLYLFADIMHFFLQYVFRYRKKVINENLRRCFPKKNRQEIDVLVRKCYKNLSDVIVEAFKAFTMSDKQLIERHKILNPELLDSFKNSERSFIATPCHYGNWEWGVLASGQQVGYDIVGFYAPIKNPHIDKLIRKNRSRTGAALASIRETSKIFDNLSSSRIIYLMMADQSPSNAGKAIWVSFLGQKTAFLNGLEKHARLRDLPVIFVDIQRVKRGFYTLKLSFITKNPKDTKDGEITASYAKCLEDAINKKPENWLWSHKRWKLNKN